VLAASLSYYALFSVAPLLLVAVAVAVVVFGRHAVSRQLELGLRGLVGESGASAIQDNPGHDEGRRQAGGGGVLASIVGVALAQVGATGQVIQLRNQRVVASSAG